MTRRTVFTIKARDDLEQISRYIARESGHGATASAFTKQLRVQCANLSALPGTMGRPRPELGAEIRSVAMRGYVVLLRYEPGLLRILRVIEGHRDIPAHVTPTP